MGISNLAFSATNINVGLDADKSDTPRAGDMYLATDTKFLYKCYVDDSWVSDELTEAKIDTAKPNIMKSLIDSYVGDGTVNRAIPHGFDAVPNKSIQVYEDNGSYLFENRIGRLYYIDYGGGSGSHVVTAPDVTNFYVGNATSYQQSANETGTTYYYVVMI